MSRRINADGSLATTRRRSLPPQMEPRATVFLGPLAKLCKIYHLPAHPQLPKDCPTAAPSIATVGRKRRSRDGRGVKITAVVREEEYADWPPYDPPCSLVQRERARANRRPRRGSPPPVVGCSRPTLGGREREQRAGSVETARLPTYCRHLWHAFLSLTYGYAYYHHELFIQSRQQVLLISGDKNASLYRRRSPSLVVKACGRSPHVQNEEPHSSRRAPRSQQRAQAAP